MGAKELIELMLLIQERQFDKREDPEESPELAALREGMPVQFAGHFDRLLSRGKRALAPVVNGTCKGCNMKVPGGTILILKKHADIQLCGNCGRYLHLPPEPDPVEIPVETPPPPRKKAVRRPRKAKES